MLNPLFGKFSNGDFFFFFLCTMVINRVGEDEKIPLASSFASVIVLPTYRSIISAQPNSTSPSESPPPPSFFNNAARALCMPAREMGDGFLGPAAEGVAGASSSTSSSSPADEVSDTSESSSTGALIEPNSSVDLLSTADAAGVGA